MDVRYTLQILRDYGRDVETIGSYRLYDDLTTAHRQMNAYKKQPEVVHLRLMWGDSVLDDWRRDDG